MSLESDSSSTVSWFSLASEGFHYGGPADTALSFARIIQQEAERKFISQHAAEIEAGTNSEKRRIRRAARSAGLDAYIDTLERIIETNEAEMTSLQSLVQVVESSSNMLINKANLLGVPLPSPQPLQHSPE